MFNVAWSLGKGTGLLAGGLLLESRGPQGLALLAAIAWGLASVAVPAMARPGDHSANVETDPQRPHPARQRAFLRSAWVANGIAFGVVATLNHHLPRRLLAAGIGADIFGLFLGLVFFAQTFTFLALAPTRKWHYRALPLVLLQGVVAAAVIATPGARGLIPLLTLAPIFGVGLGFAYQSSLYYSLHASAGRGRQAGVHEAMLGIASATVPVVGGLLALRLGDLAPFGVAAVAVVASASFATVQFRNSSLPR
jgi:MFS family permease